MNFLNNALNSTAEAIRYCEETVESPWVKKPIMGLAAGISVTALAIVSGQRVSRAQAVVCASIGAVWGANFAFISDYLPNNTGTRDTEITPANTETLTYTTLSMTTHLTIVAAKQIFFN